MLQLLIAILILKLAMVLFDSHWEFSSWRLPLLFSGISLLLGMVGFALLWGIMRGIARLRHRGPIDNPMEWIDINDPAHPIISWYLLTSGAIFVMVSTVTGHWRW